ncbi:MAG TPA: FAD-dependent monooxygenase [Actinocrinis sp.]|nr:FAD-dependent monooxygenase [Actinocrinis sp.]
MPITADVLIVGAGPTGLLLAGDLAARGVSCTVLEQRAKEAGTTRAFGVHARTLEQLDARGVADELIATGTTIDEMRLFERLRVSMARLPSRYPFVLVTPQYNVEQVLERRASKAGARILRGVRFTGLTQDGDGVEARFEPVEGADTQETECRAAYLVGADGVHSAVREALGVPFPGVTVLSSVMLADVRLAVKPKHPFEVNAVKEGFAFIAPFGDGWYRVIAWDRRRPEPESAPVDLEGLREITRLALGTDFGMGDTRWSSRFHSDERQVADYRMGRVFLAGDAAHCHSPAGGMGMNTGLQDAANLGWKLAAALDGRAPEGLLDTYNAERHPAGAMAVRVSGRIIRLAIIQPRAVRWVRDRIGTLVLHAPPVLRRAAGMMSGVAIAYPRPADAHPSVGKRAADIRLATGEGEGRVTRLYELLRDGRFVAITRADDVAGHPHPHPRTQPPLDGWKGRVEYAMTADPGGIAALWLVRPDGYIAWATDAPDPTARQSGLRNALTTWCGIPD